MSEYIVTDRSTQSGQPIWLYRFARGMKVWRFNSGNSLEGASDYVADDGTYLAVPGGFDCDDIESSDKAVRNNPECGVSRENEIAELFRVSSPTDVITVNAREVHQGDTGPDAYALRFEGEVSGCVWDAKGGAKLRFINVMEAANLPALKIACTKGCQAVLFGRGCNNGGALDVSLWEFATTIVSITGLFVEVAAVDGALPYQGGELLLADVDGNYDRRMIFEATGTTLRLTRRLPGTAGPGDPVIIRPGCNHIIEGHCLVVYANTDNFRGRSHFSGKTVMAGEAEF